MYLTTRNLEGAMMGEHSYEVRLSKLESAIEHLGHSLSMLLSRVEELGAMNNYRRQHLEAGGVVDNVIEPMLLEFGLDKDLRLLRGRIRVLLLLPGYEASFCWFSRGSVKRAIMYGLTLPPFELSKASIGLYLYDKNPCRTLALWATVLEQSGRHRSLQDYINERLRYFCKISYE